MESQVSCVAEKEERVRNDLKKDDQKYEVNCASTNFRLPFLHHIPSIFVSKLIPISCFHL